MPSSAQLKLATYYLEFSSSAVDGDESLTELSLESPDGYPSYPEWPYTIPRMVTHFP